MARKTDLIPCRQHEKRILDHCDRIDREASLQMQRCVKGCGRNVALPGSRCWRCAKRARAERRVQLVHA